MFRSFVALLRLLFGPQDMLRQQATLWLDARLKLYPKRDMLTPKSWRLLFRVTTYNRGPVPAKLHIIPQVWFRNTWAWDPEKLPKKPSIKQIAPLTAQTTHEKLGHQFCQLSPSPGIGKSGQVRTRIILPKFIPNVEPQGMVMEQTPAPAPTPETSVINHDSCLE